MRPTLLTPLLVLALHQAPALAGQTPTTPTAQPAGEQPQVAPVEATQAPAAPPTGAAPPTATPASATPPEPTPAPSAQQPLTLPTVDVKAGTERALVVRIVHDDRGFKLQVDGRDFLLRGMNWGYTPIGENYRYSLWNQPDDFVRAVLNREMTLLRDMGVNSIRQFDDIPPRWVEYIYTNYGITTVVNPLMGRYGATVNGAFLPNIDYANPAHRKALLDELARKVEVYRGVPGVALWLLGNENNYGLHWTSFEVEALPGPGQEDSARAVHLYTLMNEAARTIKARDVNHPVALANGDLQYVDLIAKYGQDIDILGTNVYRGPSVRDLFDEALRKTGKPVLFSEFGADAFNAREGREDHLAQAEYLRQQWEEIYTQTYGQGRTGNSLGGFTFQWVDGWWKMGQEANLSIHDTTASWPNGGYAADFVPGQNNMNEEWFGICALGPPDDAGISRIQPRTAYYVLQAAFRLDPYAPDTDLDRIHAHFSALRPSELAKGYESSIALAKADELSAVRVSNLRLVLDSSLSRGSIATTRPNVTASDHTESIFFDLALQPATGVYGRASFNVVGNVATNRLNNLFYENRSTTPAPTTPTTGAAPTPGVGGAQVTGFDRFALYQAEFKLDRADFALEGFYRVGHYHWGEEGDFFGLYREANYGPNVDIYHGNAPFGVVFSGKRSFEGLKIAVGPELYWGANPSIVAKYRQGFGDMALTLVHQEDIARGGTQTTASVIRERVARRTALTWEWNKGPLQLDVGGILAAPQRIGEEFTWTRDTSGPGYMGTGQEVLRDKIQFLDTLGAKARATYDLGSGVRVFAQGSFRGLVADGGPEPSIVLTGWSLRESGRGNHFGAQAGAAFQLGTIEVAPNLLYQKPLIGPNPNIPDAFDAQTGTYYPAIRARNVLADAFTVLDNRETLGAELLITYDPTPGTWFWQWDREMREDAFFAAGLDIVYRHQPTARVATIAILADGSAVAFAGAPPARDEWETTLRAVLNPTQRLKLYGTAFVGSNLSAGEDARQIRRFGVDVSALYDTLLLSAQFRVKDWGPYDYHRVFNLTYPLQLGGDLSYGLKKPVLGTVSTRFGLRGLVRMLDAYSEGMSERALAEGLEGREYEVGAYAILSL
ncbi:hypothetical protein LY474_39400 [Myxococcus stipitatus]|uniref:hypothetical protein n=1 Tax=Myxococcus stipitatus TaxID=83455 RepID=UPI001F374E7D|nr:hypothetical protein [Myxococcus stipitatus]MCE9673879.1 hypothetical protein [Myxococcus stipitatus]